MDAPYAFDSRKENGKNYTAYPNCYPIIEPIARNECNRECL